MKPANPTQPPAARGLLPLGAMAAGIGLLSASVFAQSTGAADRPPAPEPRRETNAAAESTLPEATLPAVSATATEESDRNSTRAQTTRIGKSQQELRDLPQSLSVVTEKLMRDRGLDTLKAALHNTAGVSFLAAEGGEEDIRLRGFSLATTGDIFADGLRDPAFYDRDTFANERIELLRGSASMLFGRGSTGGVVNQVSKQPNLLRSKELQATLSSGDQLRLVGDFNQPLDADSALRIQSMLTRGERRGLATDKAGLAAAWRSGIGTPQEWSLALYHLNNDNGIQYGLPWLEGGLLPVDPANAYYGAASDYNRGTASHLTLSHLRKLGGGAQWRTTLRQGWYTRDQRASAIRFFTNANPANGPLVAAPTRATFGPDTLLTRGSNNKVQNLSTTYAQSDLSASVQAWGLRHALLAGVDLAEERFQNFATVLPAGLVLNKNSPRPTIGQANDGTTVDESLRQLNLQRAFKADALGAYVQDLIQLRPAWKLLAGLRFDRFSGQYRAPATASAAETRRSRGDALWSPRAGLLFQPDDRVSLHLSAGSSFNTSGDTYQYDDQTQNTPPESSRNLELGGNLDFAGGDATLRFAIFRATKFRERNRDPDSAATQNLLSGQRHSAGLELDLAGRLSHAWEVFGSYAWVPVARIDVGAPGVPAGTGEGSGTRPSLTPRHSGTLWSTWQLDPHWRVGAGLNWRSSQTPNRNPVGVRAPAFVTADLLAEYSLETMAFKLSLNNATNRHYADSLYTAHYMPGAPRTLSVTVATRF